ncbi:FtsX-like permease family protein [Martelella lutilitoris]|uniref:FtsX-like permease family protein n=1 Tax=Martelella lutilitoris TaxID=2583532 RepID=A0A7T7HIR6_9HYPH|nr:FtsX-like permease family protein [Martelella lutilitoris]QQM29878.1 FtsX-like permease family protein [Martelella lutilitoris]
MFRFIFSDLKRLWAGSIVIVLLIALATALGVTITLQERALRLGSARASEKFDLVVGAPGSETQLVLSSVFLQPSDLPLMDGDLLPELNDDPRVAWAAPIGFGDSYAGYPIVGTTTALIEATVPGFAEGGIFVHEGDAVIGSAVDLAVGSEIKPMHGAAETGGHTHTELAYHVTGRAEPTGTPWDRAILVPIQAVWHIHGLGHEHETEADHDHDDDHDAEADHDDDHQNAAAIVAAADHHDDDHDAHAEDDPHDDDHGHASGEHDAGDHDENEHHHGAEAAAPIDEHWHRGETPGLPAILVKPKSIADAYRLRQEYREADGTVAVFPAEVLTRLYATLGDARQVLTAIAIGAQVLVAAALMLVTVIHVSQRRREIGALRAFGAPRSAVFSIVWLELFSLIGLGIAIGYGAGFLAARAISRSIMAERGVDMPVAFVGSDAGNALLLVVAAAILAALPALLAYRQPPAAALKG